jgi:hypothetical protein
VFTSRGNSFQPGNGQRPRRVVSQGISAEDVYNNWVLCIINDSRYAPRKSVTNCLRDVGHLKNYGLVVLSTTRTTFRKSFSRN